MMTPQKLTRHFFREMLLVLFDHQTLALMRWDFYLAGIRFRNRFLGARRRLKERLDRAPAPIFLNLGSGPRGRVDSHWINVDAVRYPGVDYLLDFNRALPFAKETFDGIFCEHVLEHFTLEQGQRLLSDCLRILKPGGTIRLIVPDGEVLVEWCRNRPDEIVSRRPGIYASAMESLNSYFRQRYEHKMIYDEQLLRLVLEDMGYERVLRSRFGAGVVRELFTLDDDRYREESVYVEAAKRSQIECH